MKKLTSGIIALSVVVGGVAGIVGLSPAFASTSAAPMAVVTAPAPTSTATAATVTKASQDTEKPGVEKKDSAKDTGPNIQQQVGNQTGPDTKGAPEKDGTEKKGAEKDTGPDVQQQGNFQQ
ncbi:hypothetical protein LSG31_02120 [Fodinisporobacter ferrooxydans]|uniref:Uncharacterized protein n=1 Tax=Fodinisporobacter ferrooxydans TaxID=2901836 RepID=A0ABY4CT75_9BACL|nr:hypothetical protein LSG31_02120 [Alicyclobacillaceae bacterium MYW30-H2]